MKNGTPSKKKKGLVIAVSGFHGSGRTTQAKKLSEEFCLKYVSSGEIFRKEAKKKGLSIEEMSLLTEKDKNFDLFIDTHTKNMAKEGGLTVDATLSGWMTENADLRIFLTAPFDVRVKRIAERESLPIEIAEKETRVREASEKERFQNYYGIDITDLSIYDVVLNTASYDSESTARILKKCVYEYCKRLEKCRQ
jgi:cytidylate kinase